MNRHLTVLLLFTVAMTHYLYPVLCEVVLSLHGQERGVFYVARGFEGAILFGVLIRLRPALWPVALWGLFEEAETAACRLSIGFPATPDGSPWNGLCDRVTHWPMTALGLVIAAILVTKIPKEP
jgi:hypothetical protein